MRTVNSIDDKLGSGSILCCTEFSSYNASGTAKLKSLYCKYKGATALAMPELFRMQVCLPRSMYLHKDIQD